MHVARLIAIIDYPDSGLPEAARIMLGVLVTELHALDEEFSSAMSRPYTVRKMIRSRGG